eukprot:CAMPEP_0181325250 /NCGR_PEP_ID=MMETSP1101-20121128/20817_1 /TAXON_ID=46948 /ORGANISM="Rhodomonas abbreviata, Strain Caron Lab Isolate" /LENGTH=257 /DNA_ID=CAMNT_0023433529 /DNA_START=114 /DNA_END=887 /DNA_ORIENTATION=-
MTSHHGKKHSDTVSFDDMHYLRSSGLNFDDCELKSVVVLHDELFVYAVQCTWSVRTAGQIRGPLHVSDATHGTPSKSELVLESSESITGVSMRTGAVVDQLCLTTSRGRVFRCGGNGGKVHTFPIPRNKCLLSFHGGFGGHLHNLGLYFREIPHVSEAAAIEGAREQPVPERSEAANAPKATSKSSQMVDTSVLEHDYALAAVAAMSRLECKICFERDVQSVIRPCGHACACWNCIQLLSECPVCREPVTEFIRIHI